MTIFDILGLNESRPRSRSAVEFIDHSKTKVRGVAVVEDEIFVVRERQLHLNVYDSYSLKEVRNITIPGMVLPQDMTGSAHNKALYISDDSRKCIHRVDLNDKSAICWDMLGNSDVLWGVSMTADHTLLVTVCTGTSRWHIGTAYAIPINLLIVSRCYRTYHVWVSNP